MHSDLRAVPSSRSWVIAATCLGSGMAFLDSTVVNVALPAVQTDLEVSARGAQWVYGAFALVLAAFLLIGGSLGDRYGRRRVFVLGAAIYAGAGILEKAGYEEYPRHFDQA